MPSARDLLGIKKDKAEKIGKPRKTGRDFRFSKIASFMKSTSFDDIYVMKPKAMMQVSDKIPEQPSREIIEEGESGSSSKRDSDVNLNLKLDTDSDKGVTSKPDKDLSRSKTPKLP